MRSFPTSPKILIQLRRPSGDVDSGDARVALHQLDATLGCLTAHHLSPAARKGFENKMSLFRNYEKTKCLMTSTSIITVHQLHEVTQNHLLLVSLPFGGAFHMTVVARLVAEQPDIQLKGLSRSPDKRRYPALLNIYLQRPGYGAFLIEATCSSGGAH